MIVRLLDHSACCFEAALGGPFRHARSPSVERAWPLRGFDPSVNSGLSHTRVCDFLKQKKLRHARSARNR